MEKFDTNELLRYLAIGIFFTFLNYLSIDKVIIEKQISALGSDSLSVILIAFFLVSGITIYTLYRSLFYPLVMNPFLTRITSKEQKKNISAIIIEADIKRWKKDEPIQKKLYEWGSQVHYLYNLSICCFLAFAIQACIPDFNLNDFVTLSTGITLLFVGVIHHYRYKLFENKII